MSVRAAHCTVLIHGTRYGIAVDRVQEVLRPAPLAPLPLAPPCVAGLLHLRGRILTALDLRRCLDLPARDAGEPSVHVVVREDADMASLLVDAVGDVVEVSPREWVATPETLGDGVRRLVRGAWKLDHGLLLALDVSRTLAMAHTRREPSVPA